MPAVAKSLLRVAGDKFLPVRLPGGSFAILFPRAGCQVPAADNGDKVAGFCQPLAVDIGQVARGENVLPFPMGFFEPCQRLTRRSWGVAMAYVLV
jgi:hypothetical protein